MISALKACQMWLRHWSFACVYIDMQINLDLHEVLVHAGVYLSSVLWQGLCALIYLQFQVSTERGDLQHSELSGCCHRAHAAGVLTIPIHC